MTAPTNATYQDMEGGQSLLVATPTAAPKYSMLAKVLCAVVLIATAGIAFTAGAHSGNVTSFAFSSSSPDADIAADIAQKVANIKLHKNQKGETAAAKKFDQFIECTKGASIACLKITARKEHMSPLEEAKQANNAEKKNGAGFDELLCECLANVDTTYCSADIARNYGEEIGRKCHAAGDKEAYGFGGDFGDFDDFEMFGEGASTFSLMM